MDNSKIFELNKKSVLLVRVFIPGLNNQAQISIRGTGFIVSKDGKFITNAHVYKEIPQDQLPYLEAQVFDREEKDGISYYKQYKIELIKMDENNDLALMRLITDDVFVSINNFGHFHKLVEGDEVVFLGFPLATELLSMGFGLTLSMNHSIISSVKRSAKDGSLHFFMIDTHVNNGSSGSPIFLKNTGEVVGIVSGRISSKIPTTPNTNSGNVADIPANMGICRPIIYAKNLIDNNG